MGESYAITQNYNPQSESVSFGLFSNINSVVSEYGSHALFKQNNIMTEKLIPLPLPGVYKFAFQYRWAIISTYQARIFLELAIG